MRKLLAALLAVFFLAGCLATHKTYTYKQEGTDAFTFEYPPGWSVVSGIDEVDAKVSKDMPPPPVLASATPPEDAHLWFGIWMPVGVTNFDEAPQYLDSLNRFLLTDVDMKKPWDGNLNGMPAEYWEGTAKKDGEDLEVHVVLFEPVSKEVGIALYVGTPQVTEQYAGELKAILKSITPLKKP